ncbi:Pol [Symbiodinium sp. CCMP2592]|nr:Pol [Symbiodinium sp. CCMP2592]
MVFLAAATRAATLLLLLVVTFTMGHTDQTVNRRTAPKAGRWGPKSPGGDDAEDSLTMTSAPDARVAASTASAAEATQRAPPLVTAEAKHSGEALAARRRQNIVKRSYRRALRRAQKAEDGTTYYRGRRLHLQQLGAPTELGPRTQQTARQCQPPPGTRLRVFSINLGGVCTTTYDILMTWMQEHKATYDILFFQEVHYGLGKALTEYTVPNWHIISSPDPHHRWSGVTVCVSSKLVSRDDIQYQEVVPGRILHVRLPIGCKRQSTSLEIVSVYQWAWDADPAQKRAQKRHLIWSKLNQLLGAAAHFPKYAATDRRAWPLQEFAPKGPQAAPATVSELTTAVHDCCVELFPAMGYVETLPDHEAARRALVDAVLQEAEQAARKGDMFREYEAIVEYFGRIFSQGCPAVRILAGREVHDRRAGAPKPIVAGAAILSIDMSKAFDQVDHQYMASALRFVGIDEDTIAIILALHRAEYHVRHKQHEGTIALRNGIRQGCVLSPLLWACVTAYMLHRAELQSANAWIADDVTAYADDFASAFDLSTVEDARVMTKRVQSLFQALAEAGMQVNADKSHLLLRATGVAFQQWLKKHETYVKNRRHLNLGTPFQPILIPIVDRIEYLGTVMSFGLYEDQTVQLRLKAARTTVARLRGLLFSRKGLTIQQSLQMYRTCVRSTLLHGVLSTGITAAGLRTLEKFEIKHIRAIACSPSHLFRERSADLQKRLQYEPIADALGRMYHSCQQQAATLHFPFPGDRVLEQRSRLLYEAYQETLQARMYSTLTQCDSAGVPCPVCGVYYSDQRIMRIHCAKSHHISLVSADLRRPEARAAIDVASHSVDAFRSVDTAVLDSANGSPYQSVGRCARCAVRCGDPESQRNIDADWVACAEKCGERLRHYCIFCTQWCSYDRGGVKTHMRRMHAERWALRDAVLRRLKKHHRLRYRGPCKACAFTPASSALHAPNCPAYFQACMMFPLRNPEVTLHDGLSREGDLRGVRTAAGTAESSARDSRSAGLRQTAQVAAPVTQGLWRWARRTPRQGAEVDTAGVGLVGHEHSQNSLSQAVSGDELREVVALLTRLALRHEDTEAALRTDCSFLLYMDTQGMGMTAQLFKISQEWKEKKEAVPPQVKQSLRTTLLVSIMVTMRQKMEQALTPEMRPTLVKHGWITAVDPPSWAYLRWNPTTERQEVDNSRPPLPHSEALNALTKINELAGQDGLLHKFHATRKMASEYRSPVLPFLIMVSNRGSEAQSLHQSLIQICDNSCLRLVGARLRQERMKRQPLMNAAADLKPKEAGKSSDPDSTRADMADL